MNKPQITHFADEYTLARLAKLEAVAEAAQIVYAMCVNMGDFRNGNYCYGIDEGEVMADKELTRLKQALDALEGGQDDG